MSWRVCIAGLGLGIPLAYLLYKKPWLLKRIRHCFIQRYTEAHPLSTKPEELPPLSSVAEKEEGGHHLEERNDKEEERSADEMKGCEEEEENLKKLRSVVHMGGPWRNYTLTEVLDEGGQGKVFSAVGTFTGRRVAIKVMKADPRPSKSQINEILTMRALNHPNTVSYIDSYFDGKHLMLVMEYMAVGSLSDLLAVTRLGEGHIATVCGECLKGLAYIHSKQVIHRDIKSRNIMIGADGSVKLTDFGLCLTAEQSRASPLAGTPHWIAPEVLRGNPYSPKVDVWALGITILEMLGELLSYFAKPSQQAMELIATEGLPPLENPHCVSPILTHLLNCCLEVEVSKRSSASDLLEHPFLELAQPLSRPIAVLLNPGQVGSQALQLQQPRTTSPPR